MCLFTLDFRHFVKTKQKQGGLRCCVSVENNIVYCQMSKALIGNNQIKTAY